MRLTIIVLVIHLVQQSIGETDEKIASCFCKLDGALEDCPCKAATVDTFNSELRPKLLPLLSSYYFRYFQVDFNRPCTFWSGDEGQCSNPGCGVNTCNEGEIPISLQEEQEIHKIREEPGFMTRMMTKVIIIFPILEPYYQSIVKMISSWGQKSSCIDRDPVDLTIKESHKTLLNEFCPLDPFEDQASCQYVDLIVNNERFTGYSGRASRKVWEKVYNDLCFHPEKDEKSFDLTAETIKDLCFEKRAFYRVISAMHASITIHITSLYPLDNGDWGRNKDEFNKRFSPSKTEGEGPERLKNLYFLYLLELKALNKATPLFKQIDFKSEDETINQELRNGLNQLLKSVDEFPDHFDESVFFQSEPDLITEFKEQFRSISLLMDCLGCERCTVWAKLQITGIGTTLKVLFTDITELNLSRHEFVALLNAFGRISTSIHELKRFRESE